MFTEEAVRAGISEAPPIYRDRSARFDPSPPPLHRISGDGIGPGRRPDIGLSSMPYVARHLHTHATHEQGIWLYSVPVRT
jgi:hypothetical protein